MGRTLVIALALLLAVGALGSCGAGGAQIRPYVVATWPDHLQTAPGPVAELKVTWNEPVTILNGADLQVYDGPYLLETVAIQREAEPECAYVRLASGAAFPAGRDLTLVVVEGAVINGLDHYAEEPYYASFNSAFEPPLLVAVPGAVAFYDLDTLTTTATVPTPAGTEAIGIVSIVRVGVARRIWVQLDSGGGTGASLAWFDEGDAAMTPVALPTTGGDLLAQAAALTLTPDAEHLYAAYRDDAGGTVRVFHVDPVTAVVEDFLDLQGVPAGPSTWPADLELREGAFPNAILIPAFDGATGTLGKIEPTTFTEEDLVPSVAGIQGVLLDGGAGPIAPVLSHVAVAPAGTTDITLVAPDTALLARPSSLAGSNVDVIRTPDSAYVIQALAGFPGSQGLQLRSYLPNYADPTGIVVSDDVGGVSQGITGAVALQWIGGGSLVAALFDSPGGLVLTLWEYSALELTQLDMDAGTSGVQGALVSAQLPGATHIGRTWGLFAP